MDQPKIERVLRMITMMIGNNNLTINEMAERLDISYRSVYRYIDTFERAGFVVRKIGDYYRLEKDSQQFKDISQLMHFTEEEAYIVNSLIDNIDDNNVLKQNLRKKLASIYNFTSLADCIVKGKDAPNVHTIIDAIDNQRQVKLKNYASSNTGKIRDRLVEPFSFTTNYVQIWCYDLESSCNKLFKTARIGSVEMLDDEWVAKDKHDSGHIDIFRISSKDQIPVKLELGVMSHNLIIEEYPMSERDIKQIGDGKWLLDTKVCDYRGVTRFVVGLADDIKIIDSPGLKEYIKEFVRKNISTK